MLPKETSFAFACQSLCRSYCIIWICSVITC